jgi:FAD/FMN-containing dehydrogenase
MSENIMQPAEEITISPTAQGVSRRQFLKSGTLVATGLALGLPWFGGCRKSAAEANAIWEELEAQLTGTLFRPNYRGYRDLASPWALQYDNVLPRGIAACVTTDDIKACLRWAKKHNIPMVARSGGHSYGGYSTTSGLLVDVSRMNKVSFDAATGRITAQAGARNRQVFNAGKEFNVSITHGRCFEVGVAGLTLGGGIGFDMRKNGYTCDRLVETDIILADGEMLTCNAQQNADLFWACRGAGGGNFGIHTRFVFDTFPTGEITVFNIVFEKELEAMLLAVQQLLPALPDTFGLKLSVAASGPQTQRKLRLSLMGSYEGSKEATSSLLQPLLDMQAPSSFFMKTTGYWEGQELISEEGFPEYSHERSRFVKGYLTRSAIQIILERLEQWPGTSKGASWKFFLLGGAIDQKAPGEMAMVHRGYTMLSSINLEWSELDSEYRLAANKKWMDDFHRQMAPFTSLHCYQNFIDPHEENYLQAYYGQNLDKLIEVKRRYDPDNFFSYPQSIPVI